MAPLDVVSQKYLLLKMAADWRLTSLNAIYGILEATNEPPHRSIRRVTDTRSASTVLWRNSPSSWWTALRTNGRTFACPWHVYLNDCKINPLLFATRTTQSHGPHQDVTDDKRESPFSPPRWSHHGPGYSGQSHTGDPEPGNSAVFKAEMVHHCLCPDQERQICWNTDSTVTAVMNHI